MLSVGHHYIWKLGDFVVHGQVLISSWIVMALIFLFVRSESKKELYIAELTTEFVWDLAKSQIGEEEYLKWVPFLGTIFIFIFVSNWSGTLLPWKLIKIPNGELGACTGDIYTTVSLAALTSISYFFAGLCFGNIKMLPVPFE